MHASGVNSELNSIKRSTDLLHYCEDLGAGAEGRERTLTPWHNEKFQQADNALDRVRDVQGAKQSGLGLTEWKRSPFAGTGQPGPQRNTQHASHFN
jgi:hypothetical protein